MGWTESYKYMIDSLAEQGVLSPRGQFGTSHLASEWDEPLSCQTLGPSSWKENTFCFTCVVFSENRQEADIRLCLDLSGGGPNEDRIK